MENAQIVWDAQTCTHCLLCAEICPTSALPVANSRLQAPDQAACVLCGRCVIECPEDSLTITGLSI